MLRNHTRRGSSLVPVTVAAGLFTLLAVGGLFLVKPRRGRAEEEREKHPRSR